MTTTDYRQDFQQIRDDLNRITDLHLRSMEQLTVAASKWYDPFVPAGIAIFLFTAGVLFAKLMS